MDLNRFLSTKSLEIRIPPCKTYNQEHFQYDCLDMSSVGFNAHESGHFSHFSLRELPGTLDMVQWNRNPKDQS